MQTAVSHGISTPEATSDRRLSERVAGPFDAWRLDLLKMPMRIYDVSEGGCFVNAMLEAEPGVIFDLKVEFPDEGWILLKAETLYHRPGFGYAVRFVDMPDATARRLSRALRRLSEAASR